MKLNIALPAALTASSLVAFSLVVFSVVVFSPAVLSQTAAPTCQTTASDSDGDGWGWENNQSCMVESTTSACVDTDGDGWGWNGTDSCLVETTISEPPVDVAACVDSNGDGYGWNGTDTCFVTPPDNTRNEPMPENPLASSCVDTAPLNDSWGWNGTESCRIAPVLTPQDTSAIAGVYEIPDDFYTAYLVIGSDGFFTVYESEVGQNCFHSFNDNGIPEEFSMQFIPLGGNFYELYTYLLFDGRLEEDRDTFEIYKTDDGSIKITYTDTFFDEFNNELDETITEVYPSSDVDISSLETCN